MQSRVATLSAWCERQLLICVCILPHRVVETDPRIEQIREKVEEFAASFPMPGFAVGNTNHNSNGKVHIAPAVGAKSPYANGDHSNGDIGAIKPTSAGGAIIS